VGHPVRVEDARAVELGEAAALLAGDDWNSPPMYTESAVTSSE